MLTKDQILEAVEDLGLELMKRGMPIAPFLILGKTNYQSLLNGLETNARFITGHYFIGITTQVLQLHTAFGSLQVKCAGADLPTDHLALGDVTLDSLIIDDILLGDDVEKSTFSGRSASQDQ